MTMTLEHSTVERAGVVPVLDRAEFVRDATARLLDRYADVLERLARA